MVQMLMTPLSFTFFFTALSEHLDCALVIGGDLNFGLNKEMDRLSTAGTQRNWESTNIKFQVSSFKFKSYRLKTFNKFKSFQVTV